MLCPRPVLFVFKQISKRASEPVKYQISISDYYNTQVQINEWTDLECPDLAVTEGATETDDVSKEKSGESIQAKITGSNIKRKRNAN